MTDEINDPAVIRRFHEKWDKDSEGCWIWQAYTHKSGYGIQQVFGEAKYAHRISHRIHHGDIGDKYVLHKCDVKSCVNPDHLYLGTQEDNVSDARKRGQWGKTSAENSRKLNWEQVDEIRRKYADGEKNGYELADEYGVSDSLIYQIVNLKQWTTRD